MTLANILIVEDDGILAMYLSDLLQGLGYSVYAPLATGEAAITFALNSKPDLILMDIKLSGEISGTSAADVISQNTSIPIIFLTSYASNTTMEQAKMISAYGYLVKPVAERDLLTTIELSLYKNRIDQQLRESESRFRNLSNAAPVLIWMSGTDGLCNYFNVPWLKYTGRSLEQELGNGWTEGLHPDDYQLCLNIYQSSFLARREFKMGYRLLRANREYGYILDNGVPRFTPQGEFTGYIGSCVDVSEQKKIEKELKDSRDFAMQVVNTMGQGLIVTNPQGQLEFINPAFAQLSGIKPEKVLGKHPRDIGMLDTQPELDKLRINMMPGNKPSTFETNLKRPDGNQLPVLVSAVPRMPDTPQDGIIAVVTDMSDLKKAQKKIEDMALRYQTILQTASDGIHVLDEQGNVIEVNESFCNMLGYSREELLSMNVSDWDLKWSRDELRSMIINLIEKTGMFETQHICKSGSIRDVEIYSTGLVLDNNRYLYNSARDITERRFAENELKRTRDELEAAHQSLKKSFEREQQLARKDPLTSVNNLRYFFELARHEFDVSQRYDQPLSVVMLDIDNFKNINDSFGHSAGDQVLSQTAQAISDKLRTTDIFGRYGGDEFVIVLPGTNTAQTLILAERICAKIREKVVQTSTQEISIKISMGIAEIADLPDGGDLELLIHLADLALLSAKHAGRDQIWIYQAESRSG